MSESKARTLQRLYRLYGENKAEEVQKLLEEWLAEARGQGIVDGMILAGKFYTQQLPRFMPEKPDKIAMLNDQLLRWGSMVTNLRI